MNPCLSVNDTKMFYKYLDTCKIYFEYGSGGSTYQASIRDNIVKIYSVESDKIWLDKVKRDIKKNNITYFFIKMGVIPNTWGNPGPHSTRAQHISYSDAIKKLSNLQQKSIDFILIDGRFRVACCLKCFDLISSNCVIAFDDFLNRPQYHVVLDYYDIIEKTDDNRMVILKKKKNVIAVPAEILLKYELIAI
jgi:hypothetical protein